MRSSGALCTVAFDGRTNRVFSVVGQRAMFVEARGCSINERGIAFRENGRDLWRCPATSIEGSPHLIDGIKV